MPRRKKHPENDVPIINNAIIRRQDNACGEVISVFRTGISFVDCTGRTKPCPYEYVVRDSSGNSVAFAIPLDQMNFRTPFYLVGKMVHLWRDGNKRVHVWFLEEA